VGEETLKTYITNYYKGLFGSLVSNLENKILSNAFSENGIKKAIFQMEHNKAPGPNGFPTEFYHTFGT
jgi:hypothetical protein